MDVERITLAQFWELMCRASANGIDKPIFRRVSEQLDGFPRTQERLLFETIDEFKRSINRKVEPWTLAGWILYWSSTTRQEIRRELLDALQEITISYFAAIPQLKGCVAEITLPRLLHTIRRLGGISCAQSVLENLRHECATKDATDPRLGILAKIERSLDDSR
jgi:hypothetical protein